MGDISDLRSQLQLKSEKKQLQVIPQLYDAGEQGLEVLMDFCRENQNSTPNLVLGGAYQALYKAQTPTTQEFLQTYFPQGLISLNSDKGIDYQPLQKLLAQQNFQQADILTLQKLCELAGKDAVQRKWIYFTEVEQFPSSDLKTIDTLWWIHSAGKFGFSTQREIWLGQGKNFSKLWPKIGWKNGNNWPRYPSEFTWDLSAPRGHLPSSNQLRGVRVMASLLSHPAWSSSS